MFLPVGRLFLNVARYCRLFLSIIKLSNIIKCYRTVYILDRNVCIFIPSLHFSVLVPLQVLHLSVTQAKRNNKFITIATNIVVYWSRDSAASASAFATMFETEFVKGFPKFPPSFERKCRGKLIIISNSLERLAKNPS